MEQKPPTGFKIDGGFAAIVAAIASGTIAAILKIVEHFRESKKAKDQTSGEVVAAHISAESKFQEILMLALEKERAYADRRIDELTRQVEQLSREHGDCEERLLQERTARAQERHKMQEQIDGLQTQLSNLKINIERNLKS